VPTSWATEFAEVGNLAKCKFGVSQDLTCTYKRRLYIFIWADSYCREFPLPLYYCVFLLYNVVYVNVMVFHYIKDKDNTW